MNRPPSIKIALYLDPVTGETGALRVIPGSHRPGDTYADFLQEQIRESDSLWGVEGRDLPAYALESEPGDVVCFNHNCHTRYSEDRLDELREYIGHSARFWIERVYGEAMIRTAGPERMVHLEQMLANDGHLAELSRRRRAEMTERSRG